MVLFLASTISVALRLHAAEKPLQLGHLKLVPQAFLEMTGEWRSAATGESISTSFGQIPLGASSNQWIASPRQSRPMVHAYLTLGQFELTTYLESDFMNFRPGEHSFRLRQYWQRVRFGRWEVVGGQAWSLLRPNRLGIEPERDLMNTDVVEPNYHVGLAGNRRRQLRIAYQGQGWKAAVAWEGTFGLWVAKVVRDRKHLHLEAAAFTGRASQRGLMAAQVYQWKPRLRLVGQQFVSRHALAEALGIVARGASGGSTLGGTEISLTPNLELFSYAGALYAGRSNGNRLVRQYTVGLNHQLATGEYFGPLVLSVQYSELDRVLWQPRSGSMSYIQTRLRLFFN